MQAFSTTFTFVPNGMNLAFVIKNNTNDDAANAGTSYFSAGAGFEGGFYQGSGQGNGLPVNHIFALMLDSAQPNGIFSTVLCRYIRKGSPLSTQFSWSGSADAASVVSDEQNKHFAGAPELASGILSTQRRVILIQSR